MRYQKVAIIADSRGENTAGIKHYRDVRLEPSPYGPGYVIRQDASYILLTPQMAVELEDALAEVNDQ